MKFAAGSKTQARERNFTIYSVNLCIQSEYSKIRTRKLVIRALHSLYIVLTDFSRTRMVLSCSIGLYWCRGVCLINFFVQQLYLKSLLSLSFDPLFQDILYPDPILQLSKVVGFGGGSYKKVRFFAEF